MIVLRILLLLLTYLCVVPVVQTAADGPDSIWHLVETVNSKKAGILKKEETGKSNGKNHGQDHGKEHGMNARISNTKKNTGLEGNIDLSCSTSADCSKPCKLCDGQDHNSFCLCQKGKCKKIDRENISPNQASLNLPRRNCIQNGKCIFMNHYPRKWTECNGECIKYGSLCDGQCPEKMCRNSNKCFPPYDIDNEEVRKSCNGECMGLTETCEGRCAYDQCLMNDGRCFHIEGKSQNWKSCKGKCIKSTLKCDASCSWGQCEKNDGTCAYAITEDDTNGWTENRLKFGICAGQCVDILTNTTTPDCHDQCELIPGTNLEKFEKGICHLVIHKFARKKPGRMSW